MKTEAIRVEGHPAISASLHAQEKTETMCWPRYIRVICVLCMLPIFLATNGCGPSNAPSGTSSGAAAPATAAASASATTPTPADKDDPCRLLTDAEVRNVFPDAKAGVRERSREKYGIRACKWETGGGQVLSAELWAAEPGKADYLMNEVQGLSVGFLDIKNANAQKNMRYEKISGVGEQAIAAVEKQDAARGILADLAFLLTVKGNQTLALGSSSLAHGERTDALRSLVALAQLASARM